MASICCSPPESSAAALRAALLEHREQLVDPVLGLRLRGLVLAAHAAGAEVLLHGEPAEDPPSLRAPGPGPSGRSAPGRGSRGRCRRSAPSPDSTRPRCSRRVPGDGAQQRRLPGPVAAEDGDDLAVGDLHGDPAHRLDGAAVGHVQRIDAQHGQHFLSAPRPSATGRRERPRRHRSEIDGHRAAGASGDVAHIAVTVGAHGRIRAAEVTDRSPCSAPSVTDPARWCRHTRGRYLRVLTTLRTAQPSVRAVGGPARQRRERVRRRRSPVQ